MPVSRFDPIRLSISIQLPMKKTEMITDQPLANRFMYIFWQLLVNSHTWHACRNPHIGVSTHVARNLVGEWRLKPAKLFYSQNTTLLPQRCISAFIFVIEICLLRYPLPAYAFLSYRFEKPWVEFWIEK